MNHVGKKVLPKVCESQDITHSFIKFRVTSLSKNISAKISPFFLPTEKQKKQKRKNEETRPKS